MTAFSDRANQVLALLLGIGAVIVLTYLPSFAGMTSLWGLMTFRHAYLVPPICAYLLWTERSELTGSRLSGSWLAVLALAGTVVAWWISRVVGVQATEHLALMLLIPFAAFAVMGRTAFEPVAFPLFFLLAAVPIGDQLVPPMMVITADIAEALLHLVGEPVLRQRQIFELPYGSFEVANVCAGVRYILSGVVTAVIFGYWTYRSWIKRLLFVAVTVVVLAIANGVRAFLVMYLYSESKGRIFAHEHIGFGLALFGVVMLLVILAGRRFADPVAAPRPHADAKGQPLFSRSAIAPTVAALIVLLAGPLLDARRGHVDASAATLPTSIALQGCDTTGEWSADWGPYMVGSDEEVTGSFQCGASAVNVFVSVYHTEQQGKEVVGADNDVIPDDWRNTASFATTSFDAGAGNRITINEVRHRAEDATEVVWYWYSVGDRAVARGTGVKMQQAIDALTLRHHSSAIYLVSLRGNSGDLTAIRDQLASAARSAWQETASARKQHRTSW